MKDEISVTIRFPKELHERLTQDARRELRSFNSQVILLLLRQYPDIAESVLSEK